MTPGQLIATDAEGYATRLPDGSCVAYWDAMGSVWTIGFGSTGAGITKGTRWSRLQAEAAFDAGWNKARAGVLRASPVLLGYPNKLDAITDFAYNLGIGRYQSSTLRRLVNQCRWTEAAREFAKWNLAGGKVRSGLVKRRAAESRLFLQPDHSAIDSSNDSLDDWIANSNLYPSLSQKPPGPRTPTNSTLQAA